MIMAHAMGAIAVLLILAACSHAPLAPPSVSTERGPEVFTVAVLPFEDNSIAASAETAGLGRSLAEGISAQLIDAPGVILIDRESIDKVLEELALSSGNMAEDEGRLRLGRLLGAHYLILGGFMAIGPSLRIDARIVEVERGLAEGTATEGTLSERRQAEIALSTKVAQLFSSKLGAYTQAPPVTSADHLRKGLALERIHQDDQALAHYQQALALDGNNQRARVRMEALLLKEIE